MSVILEGTLAAVFTSFFAAIGGFLVFLKKNYNTENINFLLNVAAGVMLSSSVFTLLAPAAASLSVGDESRYMGAFSISLAVIGGMLLVWLMHFIVPHEHEPSADLLGGIDSKSAWLFVFAIAIHKFPEGLAVGVAYAGEKLNNPNSLVIGIALQNIPEGLMVALSLVAVGWKRFSAAGIAALTGLMQPVGAMVGAFSAEISATFVPFAMAMAGGCMLFVIINEIIPQTYGCGENGKQTLAIMLGFVLMMYINMALG